MKVALIILLWIVGYLLTLFLLMLLRRLDGEEPYDVYTFEDDNIPIYMVLTLGWPLGLAIILAILATLALRKWFVLAIETIVTVKEIKEEEAEEDDDDYER